jgi:hypothetical protein
VGNSHAHASVGMASILDKKDSAMKTNEVPIVFVSRVNSFLSLALDVASLGGTGF